MERRYILNAIDAALQAGEKILSIYDDPASDFQVEKKRIILLLLLPTVRLMKLSAVFWLIHFPSAKRGRQTFAFFGTTELGNFMDCRPFGRYEGVHQEEW